MKNLIYANIVLLVIMVIALIFLGVLAIQVDRKADLLQTTVEELTDTTKCNTIAFAEIDPDEDDGYILLNVVSEEHLVIDSTKIYLRYDLSDPCHEPDTFYCPCPEPEPVVISVKKVAKKKTTIVKKKVVKKKEVPAVVDTIPVVDSIPETIIDVPVSFVVEETVEEKTTTLLDECDVVPFSSKTGFAKDFTDFSYLLEENGDIIGDVTFQSIFDGEKVNLQMIQNLNGQTFPLYNKEKTFPLGTISFGQNSVVLTKDFQREVVNPGYYEINKQMKLWGKIEIWSGVGLVTGAATSQVVLRFRPDAVYQDEVNNGVYVANFNPVNQNLAFNQTEEAYNRTNTRWQIANYVGAGVGAFLIWDGHRRVKNSKVWMPETIGYENGLIKATWKF